MKKIFLGLLVLFFCSCSIRNMPAPIVKLSRNAIEQMKGERSYWIEVQIPQRKLILAKGSHIIKTFSVAVGLPEYPTPTGVRSINTVIWNPWWYPPPTSDWVDDATPVPPRSAKNPLGEIKMPLGKDSYLIHGTKAVESIGRWASHGCIRMLFEDVFGLVQLMLTEYVEKSAVVQMERANRAPETEFATPLTHNVPVVLTYEPVKVDEGYVTIYPDFYNKFPDMNEQVVKVTKPYLKKRKPDLRKIQNLFKTFKNRTIHVPLEAVSS